VLGLEKEHDLRRARRDAAIARTVCFGTTHDTNVVFVRNLRAARNIHTQMNFYFALSQVNNNMGVLRTVVHPARSGSKINNVGGYAGSSWLLKLHCMGTRYVACRVNHERE